MGSSKPKVAIVGSGVSGLTAAYALRNTHEVTLFEADARLGGHAHTHELVDADGQVQHVDSGFIVHNNRNYPTLLRLFSELGIKTQPTEMSMSISCAGCGLAYAGGKGIRGILAQPSRLLDPKFVHMLWQVPRFHREARALLAREDREQVTWGQFLANYSDYFVSHFAIPLVACVWSAGTDDAKEYPAAHLFEFLANHGMLSISGSPQWRTVTGGSVTYVRKVAEQIPDIRLNSPVLSVNRRATHVDVESSAGVEAFDSVVIAVHADTALAILSDASEEERAALQSIGYSNNHTVLHTDLRNIPASAAARASWNYQLDRCAAAPDAVLVTYWMNKLQDLHSTTPYLVSLNAQDRIPDNAVIARMQYAHPIFTEAAVSAASVLRSAGGPRLAFAGAHLGWGFHEDGARSGLAAAHKLGATW